MSGAIIDMQSLICPHGAARLVKQRWPLWHGAEGAGLSFSLPALGGPPLGLEQSLLLLDHALLVELVVDRQAGL